MIYSSKVKTFQIKFCILTPTNDLSSLDERGSKTTDRTHVTCQSLL